MPECLEGLSVAGPTPQTCYHQAATPTPSARGQRLQCMPRSCQAEQPTSAPVHLAMKSSTGRFMLSAREMPRSSSSS